MKRNGIKRNSSSGTRITEGPPSFKGATPFCRLTGLVCLSLDSFLSVAFTFQLGRFLFIRQHYKRIAANGYLGGQVTYAIL